MTNLSDARLTADDWADEAISRLLRSTDRRARLQQERRLRPSDTKLMAEREYDEKTEQLCRFLRGEIERKTA